MALSDRCLRQKGLKNGLEEDEGLSHLVIQQRLEGTLVVAISASGLACLQVSFLAQQLSLT